MRAEVCGVPRSPLWRSLSAHPLFDKNVVHLVFYMADLCAHDGLELSFGA